MKRTAVVLLLAWAASAFAQSEKASPQEEAVHNDLRAVLAGLQDAMAKGDIDRELTYMHPNVVATWHNAEVSRGRDGVRAYLNRMLSGPNKVVASYGADVNVDELSILYGGNTAISWGNAVEHFKLTSGMNLDLPARWSATLVKEGDKWLIANLHASDNLFDNPMLSAAKKTTYWAAGISLLVGLIAGAVVGRISKRPA